MADDDTEPATPAQQPENADHAASRTGVSIPSWMAAALVVVLALVIGGVGFALGRSTADDSVQQIQPIANTPIENGERPPLPPGLEGRGGPGERCQRGGQDEQGQQDDSENPDDQGRDSTENQGGQQDDGSNQQNQDQGEGF